MICQGARLRLVLLERDLIREFFPPDIWNEAPVSRIQEAKDLPIIMLVEEVVWSSQKFWKRWFNWPSERARWSAYMSCSLGDEDEPSYVMWAALARPLPVDEAPRQRPLEEDWFLCKSPPTHGSQWVWNKRILHAFAFHNECKHTSALNLWLEELPNSEKVEEVEVP